MKAEEYAKAASAKFRSVVIIDNAKAVQLLEAMFAVAWQEGHKQGIEDLGERLKGDFQQRQSVNG